MSDNFWIELSSCDEGDGGHPGSRYDVLLCTIYRHTKKVRYRAVCKNEWGSNQGRLEPHGGFENEYRADSLDELMRIAISGERESMVDMSPSDSAKMSSAIRNAIAEAEDTLDGETETPSA